MLKKAPKAKMERNKLSAAEREYWKRVGKAMLACSMAEMKDGEVFDILTESENDLVLDELHGSGRII